jgi:C4-type Zn-finger protein
MMSIMDGMGSITDVKSAEAFVKTMEGASTTLKEVLAAAEALDPPTDEEKEAMKAIKEGFEGKAKQLAKKCFK